MTFNIYLNDNGVWVWNLVGDDHKLIARSVHGFSTKQKCLEAIHHIRDSELKEVHVMEHG